MTALLLIALLAAPADAINPGLPAPARAVDRGSPAASTEGFVAANQARDFARAAYFLDLRAIPAAEQPSEGPRLARELGVVLEQRLAVDLEKLSHAPEGGPGSPGRAVLGTLPVEQRQVAIALERLGPPGAQGWVFAQDTVRAIDALFATYGPPLGDAMPEVLTRHGFGGLALWQWLGLLIVLAASWILAVLLERLLLAVFGRMARLTTVRWDDELVAASRGPLRLLLVAGWLVLGLSALELPPAPEHGFAIFERSLVIIAVAWFALRFLRLMANLVQTSVSGEHPEDPRARAVRTQLAVLRRVLDAAIWVVASALLLMQFELVRSVGVSLLASAGIAGLVIGLAAQKSISTLLAGIQLSITQPIRIGDWVVLEGEAGNVEEISLTYVIVKIWDGRRMLLPMTYFLDKPYQNWSKGSAAQLGAVTFELDFSADLEAIRKELLRVLETEGKATWDGKTQGVVVTDTGPQSITVRALVGANDYGVLWDLRCLVRERLLVFIRARPGWLPRHRLVAPTLALAAAEGKEGK